MRKERVILTKVSEIKAVISVLLDDADGVTTVTVNVAGLLRYIDGCLDEIADIAKDQQSE